MPPIRSPELRRLLAPRGDRHGYKRWPVKTPIPILSQELVVKIFVAGATGVIGRRAVAGLRAAGHEVTGLARSQEKALVLSQQGVEPAAIDLFDRAAVARAVAGHDAVVNLATAIPSGEHAGQRSAWEQNHRIRREGTGNLAEAALATGVLRFVQESITLLYADAGDRLIDEAAPVAPTWTTASALDAEAAAGRFAASGGGAAVVLRFGLLYGPDSAHTLETVAAARAGVATEPGPPSAYRSSLTSDDAATAVVAAMDAPPGTYNVVDDAPLRRRHYMNAITTALGRPGSTLVRGPEELSADFEMMTRSHRVTNGCFRQVTAWRPRSPSAWEGWRAVASELSQSAGTPAP